MSFYLPSDGSVVIVDDNIGDALPLIRLLSKEGVSSTYYSGTDDDELPANPIQKVRLAFFDIQLLPALPAHTYGRRIADLLTKIVPEDNGPFVLALWSARVTDQADEVRDFVMAPGAERKPLTVIYLDKNEFFQTLDSNADKEELLENVRQELETALPPDDIDLIFKSIDRHYISPPPIKEAKDTAREEITRQLNANLQSKVDSFQLFTIWEGIINRASGETVKNYSDIYKGSSYWDENLKHTIYLLAHAQEAKKVDGLNAQEILKSAMKTLSQTFLDDVENKSIALFGQATNLNLDPNMDGYSAEIGGATYKIQWLASQDSYRFYKDGSVVVDFGAVKKFASLSGRAKEALRANATVAADIDAFLSSYKKITPDINSKLHVDLRASAPVRPGNVYECMDVSLEKRKKFIRTYFDNLWRADGNCVVSDVDIEAVRFIELEVTPPCDFAQGKWIKSRLLPGVLVPAKIANDHSVAQADSIYKKMPRIMFEGTEYMMLFDYRLFKSINKEDEICNRDPIFRVRHELYADIVSSLSSHISRLGITSV